MQRLALFLALLLASLPASAKLAINNLDGFGVGFGAVSISNTANAVISNDQTTYTFSTQSLGAAAVDRYIVVGIVSHKTATGQGFTSVTVGGVSATAVVSQIGNAGVNESISALYIAHVPTGTTGDVVVGHSNGQLRCAISVFRLTGVNPAATDTASNATGAALSLDVPSGGAGVSVIYDNGSNTFTWTGLAEATDATVEGTGTYSSASQAFTNGQSERAVQASASGSFGNAVTISAASWGAQQ